MKRLLLGVFILSHLACLAQSSTTEDVSKYRPKESDDSSNQKSSGAPLYVVHDQHKEVEAVIDTLSKQYLQIKYIQGFRVQLYSGSKETDAKATKEKYLLLHPNTVVYISYESPIFRVKVGNYQDKIRAYQHLALIKKDFPSAIVSPDAKIEIDKLD